MEKSCLSYHLNMTFLELPCSDTALPLAGSAEGAHDHD